MADGQALHDDREDHHTIGNDEDRLFRGAGGQRQASHGFGWKYRSGAGPPARGGGEFNRVPSALVLSPLLPARQVELDIRMVDVIQPGRRIYRSSRLARLLDRNGRPSPEFAGLIRRIVRYDSHPRIRDMVQPIHGKLIGFFPREYVRYDLVVRGPSRPSSRKNAPSQRVLVLELRQIRHVSAVYPILSFASSPFRIVSGRSRAEAAS